MTRQMFIIIGTLSICIVKNPPDLASLCGYDPYHTWEWPGSERDGRRTGWLQPGDGPFSWLAGA